MSTNPSDLTPEELVAHAKRMIARLKTNPKDEQAFAELKATVVRLVALLGEGSPDVVIIVADFRNIPPFQNAKYN